MVVGDVAGSGLSAAVIMGRIRSALRAYALVERRDEPIDDGITRLCQAVTPRPPGDVCVTVMQALVGHQYPGDDIALLVLRWQTR
jgi:serine phosphatase RsbU (regulator of sigma subunit)